MSDNKTNRIRIIAGHWRGRKLTVLDQVGLRPTTDRVRETLFNWLQANIAGSRCLDLFAGTGALGLEALSRGAAHVQFVEKNPQVAVAIATNLDGFGIQAAGEDARASLTVSDAVDYLTAPPDKRFDVVFLDPPFAADLLPTAIELLCNNGFLQEHALIYIEQAGNQAAANPPWSLHREGRAGQSSFRLYRA